MQYNFNGMQITTLQKKNECVAYFERLPDIIGGGKTEEKAIEDLKKTYKTYKKSLKKDKEGAEL